MAAASDSSERAPMSRTPNGRRRRTTMAKRARRLRAQGGTLLALAIGGALGAESRYAISLALPTASGGFPWATLLINVSGAAVLGFLLTTLTERFPRARLTRPLVGTGFIGAFTTFSTWMVETVSLVRDHHAVLAAAYISLSLVTGLLAVIGGMAMARAMWREDRLTGEEAA